ncbi:MAG: preprotein translocase subunit SecG [Acidobacteriota bacterium]
MMFVLYTIHVLMCLFLIAVVLLQQGKGADLSVFGGGGTQTAFGARGAATVLHKATVGSFIAFMLTTLAIGALQSQQSDDLLRDLPEAVEEVDEAETPAAAEEAPEAGAIDAEPVDALPAADAAESTDGEAESAAATGDGAPDNSADGAPGAGAPGSETSDDSTPDAAQIP